MVFSSLVFIFVFLPITIVAYYLAPKKLKNLVIFIASLIFYSWGEPIYILLMLFSTVFSYFTGLLIDKYKNSKKISTFLFLCSIVVNVGLLGFFKYYNFIISNMNTLFHLDLTQSTFSLPLGISFYTFQTISYLVDVYLRKANVQRNFVSFGTYITMFPQLVAGPIVKYSDISFQLKNRKHNLSIFGEGAELFIIGLAKKVLLANNIGILWSAVKETPLSELSVLTAWLGIIAFTFQIYFDFSGYSDMALGLGKMFGFHFIKNFNAPYISKSITEFWRRWHISLGTWFREYVYIPLGGNRGGRLKQLRNIIIVWFLTGLWHGASWNFVLWGLYFAFFLILEKTFLLKWLEKNKIIAHIYTLVVVIIGWVFFELENISTCGHYIQVMFGLGRNPIVNAQSIYYLYTNLFLFIILAICSTDWLSKIQGYLKEKIKGKGAVVLALFYLGVMLISTAYLVNETYNPFLYFKF